MNQLTKKQAVRLSESNFWGGLTYRERAEFQLFQKLLCMPFDIFHEAMEKALKRPVYTHEFGFNWEGLKEELLGKRKSSTLEEVLNLIPEEKE